MTLTSKIEAFKRHFEIDSINADIEFCLDTKKAILLLSLKTENIFGLIKETMNSCLTNQGNSPKEYGAELLRSIKLEGPKKRVVRSNEIKFTDKQLLIINFKHEDWDIDSYSYVNEYGEFMLNEECCKTLKIPISLWSLVLFSFGLHRTLMSNYRYDFGPKLLEFLGVNTKIFGAQGQGLKHAYEEDLKLRLSFLHDIYKINMCEHVINKKEKAILKEYSDLEKEQDEWYERCSYEEGREQYLKECKAKNISFDDF